MFALQGGQEAQQILETSDLVADHLASVVDADHGLIGKRFGPYSVLALLGRGGMGSVWLAERVDGLFARRVALKLVHGAFIGRVMTERFSREREILASLNHPNIARLLDAGFAEDGQPYLALDYVAGTPFTTYCDEHRLSIRARLELFRQVLGAAQYAHAHLVIHRDLKPANILVTEEGQVQLLDFGIAKLLTEGEAKETELTQMGGRALTPDYAAPEQIAGAPITTAADVYALDERKEIVERLQGRSRDHHRQGAQEIPDRALCDRQRVWRGYRGPSARRCGAGATGQCHLPCAQVCTPALGRNHCNRRSDAHPRRGAGRHEL